MTAPMPLSASVRKDGPEARDIRILTDFGYARTEYPNTDHEGSLHALELHGHHFILLHFILLVLLPGAAVTLFIAVNDRVWKDKQPSLVEPFDP